jgi:hypothetical protein
MDIRQPCIEDKDFWCYNDAGCCMNRPNYTPKPVTSITKSETKPLIWVTEPATTSINPEHYTTLKIEPWDYIQANNLGYFEGNIVKYVSRYKKKGGREDLLKARTYLDKLIDLTPQ